MNLVAIDFSITSTAVCISTPEKIHWFSFVSNLDLNKKSFRVHKDLSDLGLNMIGYERNKPKEISYTEEQSFKLNNANYLSYCIINAIGPYIDEDTIFGIEGYSYGSRGNAFIDLISYNTFLKSKILRVSERDLLVFAPKTIKKAFTSNGNAGKPMMVQTFCERESDELLNDPFHEYVKCAAYGDNIPKPIDDLVDAFAIMEYLKDYS